MSRRPATVAVPAIVARDVAAPYPSRARPARQSAPAGDGSGCHVAVHAPGGGVRRRRTAPSAGSHRPPPSRGPAAAACWRPASSSRCCRPDARSAAPDRDGAAVLRRMRAATRRGDTTPTLTEIDAAEVFGTYSSRSPGPRHRLPGGTGARRQRDSVAGGRPAHRLVEFDDG